MLSSYLTLANKLDRHTAVLSMSGPKVKAIPATTKGREGWIAGTVIFKKVIKCFCMKTAYTKTLHQMKNTWLLF